MPLVAGTASWPGLRIPGGGRVRAPLSLRAISAEMSMMVILLLCVGATAGGATVVGGGSSGAGGCALSTMRVVVAGGASADELAGAQELALWAGAVAGREPLPIVSAATPGAPHFAVGVGAAVAAGLSVSNLSGALGEEGFAASSIGGVVALSGRAPHSTRGTLYACYFFLHRLGIRFLAPNATTVPSCPASLPVLHVSHRPLFEYRAINGWAALHDPLFARRSHINDKAHTSALLSTTAGASAASLADPPVPIPSAYARGYFVHSVYNLLQVPPINGGPRDGPGPPTKLFKQFPGWFWPRDNPATYGQVCWTNSSMVAQMALAVKSVLRSQPTARIVSISQNDNLEVCSSPEELAVAKEEHSQAGPLLRAINTIADAIADEFPEVKIDTLAYTYAQQPPILTKARPNVIIRLCTNHVDFTKPLSSPANVGFRRTLDGWKLEANATVYIWNYIADFGNLLQVFPNLFALGQDIKWL